MPLTGHPFVTRLSRLMDVTAETLGSLSAIMEREGVAAKRQDLIVHGAEHRDLCFVRSGYAIRYRLLRSGKRQILNVVLPGDVIGFPVSFFDRSSYSVVTVSKVGYTACPLGSYVRLCYEKPQFGLVLTWLAARESALCAEHIVNLGRRTPVERLAHFLLEIHDRLLEVGCAQPKRFDLPFSQGILADVLGLSVPHLNRVMQELRAERLIVSSSRLVELSDIAGLRRLAQYQPADLAPIPAAPAALRGM
jgi:CRP-like cAMP-binding protein